LLEGLGLAILLWSGLFSWERSVWSSGLGLD